MPDHPPYRAYAGIVATFVAALGAVSGVAAARNRPPAKIGATDLALLGLATFKASRTVARDKVTSFVREPFVEGEAYEGEGEQPLHDSELKQALGELVTCTRCIGTWIGAGLASVQILAPRTGRLLTSVLAAGALNDFLLAGFAALTNKSNELEGRAGRASGA
ncbi:MAG: DUF1360 domain-containing protein [Actinomycetota bacterium]|nr:DUF1360 domain-containing protein [Actinomycetota bacterium]